ncbi:hypothetical protein [Actinopolymorpha sp. B9G3]
MLLLFAVRPSFTARPILVRPLLVRLFAVRLLAVLFPLRPTFVLTGPL